MQQKGFEAETSTENFSFIEEFDFLFHFHQNITEEEANTLSNLLDKLRGE